MAIEAGPRAFRIDTQVYHLIGQRQFTASDGREVTILDWSTECPSCGEVFTTATGVSFGASTCCCTCAGCGS